MKLEGGPTKGLLRLKVEGDRERANAGAPGNTHTPTSTLGNIKTNIKINHKRDG